ncbi:MAG: chromate efflux transporter, partial [Hyphomicrobium sp.]
MNDQQQTAKPTLAEATREWARIGCLSFGGPAGQIALMHRILVEEKRWIDERRFLTGLNFCMLLPGPEAMQLATYVGWRMHGVVGGLIAGLLFVLPGALLMLALALAYAHFGSVPVAEALFLGVKAAVLAIVIEALLRVAKKALHHTTDWAIAAAAFVAIFFLAVPFPVVVIVAAAIGFARGRSAPALPPSTDARVSPAETLRTLTLWTAIWVLPLLAVAAFFGADHVLTELAWLFSKLALVTFGGAYAVLAYLAQEVVQTYGWLKPGEMLDALGLAETTPGPLILVTEFVGTLAAFREGGGNPVVMGILGAVVTLWATFAPCFLWIFVGAPYIERLNAIPALRSALSAITSAVVGVILNLTVWFALHVLFARLEWVSVGPFHFEWPDVSTLRIDAAGLAVLGAVLLFGLHRGIATTLAVTGGTSLA